MAKRIALLTAGHLSSCPRLIKEAELFTSHGFNVSIVYLNSIQRIESLDKNIISQHSDWDFHEVKWDSSFSTYLSKVTSKLSNLFGANTKYFQTTSKKLIDVVKTIKADLYIAHHPSVLVAANIAAKIHNAKYAYDIEDAFPFIEDGCYWGNPNLKVVALEKKYLKGTCFTTVASPLYADVYMQLYNLKKSPISLLNVFNIENNKIEYLDRKDLQKVSFYWYSQTVGLNRGLQDLFSAINELPEATFELHIRGMCTDEVKNSLLSLVKSKELLSNIYFHSSVSMNELSIRNKEHDLGFALETGTNLNKDLCISNKIFDYLRSSLMVVATNTSGHKYITDELGENCIAYNEKDIHTLTNALRYFIDNKELITKAKLKSLELAKAKYNWEIQSEAYLNMIVNELN